MPLQESRVVALPFSYQLVAYSQESLAQGTGVFKPRESFTQQVLQKCAKYNQDCASLNCGNYCERDIEDLATDFSDCSGSTSSLLSTESDSDEDDVKMTTTTTTQTVVPHNTTGTRAGTVTTAPRLPPPRLDTLPLEIRELISQECSQADAFHLSLACRALYVSSLQRMYQCIVFDSSHRHFNKELSSTRNQPDYGGTSKPFAYTNVRTVGGLRTCIRALKSPEKAALVSRFELLAATDLPDLEIRTFIEEVFPLMNNLGILIWGDSLTPYLTAKMLKSLSHPDKIQKLCLGHIATPGVSELKFNELKHLDIRPFTNSQGLEKLGTMIANSKGALEDLQTLRLGRETFKSHEACSDAIPAGLNPLSTGVNHIDAGNIRAFFGTVSCMHPKQKLRLTQLGLVGIVVQASDFEILQRSVDLDQITHLSLVGVDISEVGSNPRTQPVSETPRFLGYMAGTTPKLKSLELEWAEYHTDSVSQFLSMLSRLESLSLKLRWNSTKHRAISWDSLCTDSMEAIATHSSTLRQLVLDAAEDVPFADITKDITSDVFPLLALLHCLESLSIAAPTSLLDTPPAQEFLLSLEKLPRLRFFHLRNHSTKPYLGQPASYLLEDWLRYQHTVDILMNRHGNGIAGTQYGGLEYIRLEDYIFDVRDRSRTPVIREGLMRWFEDQIFDPWER